MNNNTNTTDQAATLGLSIAVMNRLTSALLLVDEGFFKIIKAFADSERLDSDLAVKFISMRNSFGLLCEELQPAVFLKNDHPVDVSADQTTPSPTKNEQKEDFCLSGATRRSHTANGIEITTAYLSSLTVERKPNGDTILSICHHYEKSGGADIVLKEADIKHLIKQLIRLL